MKNLKKYFDFKLVAILATVYLVFVLIYASKNAYLKNCKVTASKEMNWGQFIFGNTLDWLLITIFMIFIAITTKYMMRKKIKMVLITVIHLFFSFAIGAFTLGISWIMESFSKHADKKPRQFNELFVSYIELIDLHFLIYLTLVTIIYMYYYFEKVQESKMKTIKLEDQLSKTHLKFLQSQMHPHFLFNSLNSIHSLMDISIEKSKSMVVDLSDLLRSVLDKKDQNLIELQEELFILKKYIHIKKTRFSDQLDINLEVEDGLENILVPNMLIQPIVENSTKHGYDKEHAFLKIRIVVYKEHNNLIVEVQNNGKELKEKLSALLKKGTGLNNIKERLDTLYNNNYNLSVYNKSGKVYTKISIPINLSISEIEKDF